MGSRIARWRVDFWLAVSHAVERRIVRGYNALAQYEADKARTFR